MRTSENRLTISAIPTLPHCSKVFTPGARWAGSGSFEELTVDNLTTVSVSLARALQKKTTIRWRYDVVSREYGNFILLARLTEDSQNLKDFVLFPPETLTSAMNLKLNDARLAQGVLFDNLERFPEMLNRIVSSIA